MNALKGLGVATVTPFREDGLVDYKGLESLTNHLINGGVNYLVVQGTTGESATLSLTEKIHCKKTPIPFSYNVFLKLFIGAYAIMLPFGLVATFGYFAVPLVMMIFFAMIGVELMAEEIEDPFGLDCNDLPTGTIAHTIKNNVFEILTQKHAIVHKQETYDKIF